MQEGCSKACFLLPPCFVLCGNFNWALYDGNKENEGHLKHMNPIIGIIANVGLS